MNHLWNYIISHDGYSVYHFDHSKLLANVQRWIEKFPGIQPYYAVKCNNCPSILRILKEQNFSFDCASQKELELIDSLGVSINSEHHPLLGVNQVQVPAVIFANPCKFPTQLNWAYRKQVQFMTADCPEELDKIYQHCRSAQVILRIAVDDSHSLCKFNCKFGLIPSEENLQRFFDKQQELELDVVGVSFHVGSGCLSEKSYEDALQKCRLVFDFAQQRYGIHLKILDLGGGFIQEEPLLSAVSETIQRQLELQFNWKPNASATSSSSLLVIAEPGRFMVTNVFDLYVQVIGKKVVDGQFYKYYVNNTVYGAFNCKVFDYAVFTYTFYKKDGQLLEQDQPKHHSTIFGATCDSMDKILENILIPELEIGSYICFHNMGAYTYSASCEFNGIPHANLIESKIGSN